MPHDPLPSRRLLLLGLGAVPALASCSAVGAVNAVVPDAGGADRVAEGIAYGAHPRQRLDIYSPSGAATGQRPAPVVIFVYGGSWTGGSRADYAFVGRALASRGIVTVVVDYRLVPEVRFPAFVDDVAAATAWTSRHIASYGGDPRRIVVMGHSAGAYNAAMVALVPSYLRGAGFRGPPLAGFVGLAGPYDFLPFDVAATINAFGAWPRPAETQPVLMAGAGAPRTLVASGGADTTVYPRNTVRLAARLRVLRAPVVERIYPDVGHAGILLALSQPFRGKAPVLEDVVAFVHKP
jgi:acetyl esterase/lipase